MTDRKAIYDTLRIKMEQVGFLFEKEQQPHLQKRKEQELVFTHPNLINKFEINGVKVRAKKFYIKPLSDDPDCEIGLMTGTSSPLYKQSEFVKPNTIDSFRNTPAWTNKISDSDLDHLLTQIKSFLNQSDAVINQAKLDLALKQLNEKMQNVSPEKRITEVQKTLRKDKQIVALLKKVAKYKCQFPNCNSLIMTADGKNYVEVAHIKPVNQGGQSILGNILVLCPNHHKEFDYGVLKIEVQTENLIQGQLNSMTFQIKTK
jgi:hypothetical protein